MQNRFATTDGDAFRLFIHYRLKGGQTIKDYYDEKKRLGSLADLKECHIISGLIDGVPPDVELALAGLSFTSSSEWLAAAQRVETSLKRSYRLFLRPFFTADGDPRSLRKYGSPQHQEFSTKVGGLTAELHGCTFKVGAFNKLEDGTTLSGSDIQLSID
ncbi:hypothetical protein HPB52_024693 [Rhipicephalus sanguineus]|uniref:Uncharacterized protein n=1 Tax=Rhipicephalus sanguineus TaxID=34632 RepID=A0A9D4PAU1_RHISA|nr:hypothetical protein HPB52_024693 [Rhipicephalus sanguineus]